MSIVRHQTRVGRLSLSGAAIGKRLPLGGVSFGSVAGSLALRSLAGVATHISVSSGPVWSGLPSTETVAQSASISIAAFASGAAPITFALAPGSAALPAGATLSSGGVITTGISTPVATTAGLIVRATNAAGSTDSPTFSLSVTAAVISLAGPILLTVEKFTNGHVSVVQMVKEVTEHERQRKLTGELK